MAKNAGRTAVQVRLDKAEQALESARADYRRQIDAEPSRLDDIVFASEWAKNIDMLQRNVTKYSQMLDIYDGNDLDGEEAQEESSPRGDRVRAGAVRLKDTIVRSAKQGMASAVVKQVAEEALVALGEHCPPMIMLMPEPMRNAALCAIVFMATEAYPGIPMATEAGGVALLALEATAAKTFSEATEALAPKLVGMFKNLSLLPCAAGAVALLAATKD